MEKQFLDEGDRKEGLDLLSRLDKRERTQFLVWCCSQAKAPAFVEKSTGEVLDVWADMMLLIAVPFRVSPRMMFETLRRWVRRKG